MGMVVVELLWVVAFFVVVIAVVAGVIVVCYKKRSSLIEKNTFLSSSIKLNEERILALENRLDTQNAEIRDLAESNAALSTTLEFERQMHAQRIAEFNELKSQSKNEFQVLAQKILDENIKKHKESQEENLNSILQPLKQQIDTFKKRVDEVYDKETKQRHDLSSEIRHLKDLNIKISQDATNLTNALKGNNRTQGNWGEVILENLLQDSGLIKDREYILQKSYKNEEGNYLRPDVIVKLPNNKNIIIDSKVSLTSYERFMNEPNGVENAETGHLYTHVQSIKNHVKELSKKGYEDLLENQSLDFVLMFIPLEGAFLDALRYDSELFNFAYEKNIILISPTTLFAALRTIGNIWRNERQHKNVREILDAASGLYGKFYTFSQSMEKIEKDIDAIANDYRTAIMQLKDGKGSIYSRIQKLEKLGLKVKNKLPDYESAQIIEIGDNHGESEQ